jgi:hypothetical protein
MPANWGSFINTVAPFLDQSTPKTERDTAKIISNSYKLAISSATISNIPGSTIITTPPPIQMENTILETFDKTKESGKKTIPPYYTNWANSISSFWLQTQWSPFPPPGYVSPTVGVTTQFSGDINGLSIGLYNAFNNPPSPVPIGNLICTKLITAFQTHLITVTGLYNGLIPTPTGPIVGPPFPWLGIL